MWERDEGQCTFVGATGHRCAARRFLEFDHVEPVARGGKATVEGMRLRCRAHNQYEAERAFGAEFMRRKRQEARVAAARARAPVMTQHAPAHVEAEIPVESRVVAAEARAAAGADARALEAVKEHEAREQTQDVFVGLRGLGCRVAEARRAAEFSETLHGATLEERLRASLKYIGGRAAKGSAPPEGLHAPNQSTHV